MSLALLRELLCALDFVVVERVPNAHFQALTPPPVWLADLFAAPPPGDEALPIGKLPFLDHVLHEAERAWHAGSTAPVSSGPFVAVVNGEDVLLRASAVTIERRALLVLERLTGDADVRPVLQKAREHVLDIERLTRIVANAHAPTASITMDAASLLVSPLSDAQLAHVKHIADAAKTLQTSIAAVPPPPPARGRKR